MQRGKLSPLATINPLLSPGNRVPTRLLNGVKTRTLYAIIRMHISITAACTSIRNRGLPAACFDEFGLSENGRDRHVYDGPTLDFLSNLGALSALDATPLASTAIGEYDIVQTLAMDFAHPYSVNPDETDFLESDVRQALEFFAKLNGTNNGIAKILEIGGGAATVTTCTVEVFQDAIPRDGTKPLFIPTARQIVENIAAVNAQFISYLKNSNWLRALVVKQEDTVAGEVSDIINKLALIADNGEIIGPTQGKFDSLQRVRQREFGGAVYSSSDKAYLALNFQNMGRLSRVLNPSQYANLRLLLDVQPSAKTAAGSASQVRVTLLELERANAEIVSESLPFIV